MKFDTYTIKPSALFIRGKLASVKPTADQITGINPTDIFGLINDEKKTVTVSFETWKRIEILAEILSAVDMTINQDKLNEILGGRS